ncbi:MAG: hypothetical protein ACJAW1_002277 [Glaciecola sp.]|jgi:hypothetical protein
MRALGSFLPLTPSPLYTLPRSLPRRLNQRQKTAQNGWSLSTQTPIDDLAQRLKLVFGIEIETCEQCGGAVKLIARLHRQIGRKADLSMQMLPVGLDTGMCLMNIHW